MIWKPVNDVPINAQEFEKNDLIDLNMIDLKMIYWPYYPNENLNLRVRAK